MCLCTVRTWFQILIQLTVNIMIVSQPNLDCENKILWGMYPILSFSGIKQYNSTLLLKNLCRPPENMGEMKTKVFKQPPNPLYITL